MSTARAERLAFLRNFAPCPASFDKHGICPSLHQLSGPERRIRMRRSAHQRVVERRLMCKNDSSSTLVLAGASDAEPIEQRGGSRLNRRPSMQGDIGICGIEGITVCR